jgi:uncharacterized repeat protein (TIGR01451 family)
MKRSLMGWVRIAATAVAAAKPHMSEFCAVRRATSTWRNNRAEAIHPQRAAAGSGVSRSTCLLATALLAAAAVLVGGPASAQSRSVFGTAYSGTTNFTFTLGGVAGNTATLSNIACLVGNPFGGGSAPTTAGSPNYPDAFYSPTPTSGVTAAISVLLDRNAASAVGCAADTTPSYRATLNFAQTFDSGAVRMHWLNLDAGQYQFSPTPGLSVVRLSGNNEFEVTGTLVNSTPRVAVNNGCQTNAGANISGGCGSVRLDTASGTLSQLVWDAIDSDPFPASGDAHAAFFSLTQPSLLIRKRTIGGTGSNSFTFSYPSNVQSNAATPTAATTESIAVAANNTFVNGQPRFIANSALATTVTEAVPAGWVLTSASCYDVANANTVVASLATPVTGPTNASLTLAAANVSPGAQIQCDFTNTALATLQLAKAWGANSLAGDQVAIGATSGGTNNTAVFSATAPAAANSGTPVVVTTGDVIVLPAETGTSLAARYTTTVACTGGHTLSGTNGQQSNTLTITSGNAAVCTYTNTPIPPTLRMTKALAGNRLLDSNQFTMQIRTGSATGTVVNSTTNSTTTGTGSTITAGSGTTGIFTAAAGTQYFLTEAAAGSTSLAGYTATITCTDANGFQTGLPAGAAFSGSISITPVRGAAISCVLTNTPVAAGPPWTCDAFGYLFQSPTPGNNILTQIDLVTGASTVVGNYDGILNGVGYNTLDHYFYAWNDTTAGLVRVSSDLSVTPLGTPVGVIGANVGDFDDAGHLWQTVAGGSNWVAVDFSNPASATYGQVIRSGTLTFPGGYAGFDWSWINGSLYMAMTNGALVPHLGRFTPGASGNGTFTDLGAIAGMTGASGQRFGATYTDPGGYLYASDNNTGRIYRVTVTGAPSAILLSTATGSFNNDGARCAAAPIPTVTVVKNVAGRAAAADQFTVSLVSSRSTTLTSATTVGAATSATTTNWPVTQGTTYILRDAMAAGSASALSVYTATVACTDANSGNPVAVTGTGPDWSLTIPSADAFICTITNTPRPQLTILKTASAANFVVGVPASYTLQVTNTGVVVTTAAATVSDAIPASLTPGAAPAGCTITGQNVSCTVATGLAVGASVSFVIPVTPAAAAAGTTVTNTATVNGGGDTGCPAATRCSSTTNTPVGQTVNLAIAKMATPNGTYLPGQALNYSIVVTNNGPSPASGISVSDTVPATVTVSGWTCAATGAGADCDTTAAGTGATGTGNAISLSSVSLGSGNSLTISVSGTAQLSATGAIVNTATAAPPAAASCTTPPCTVTSTVTSSNGGAPQLTITKTATPGAFAVGQPATYSLQVRNTGSSSTAGVITVSDPLPAGITTTATPSGAGWNCSASTTTQVNCSTSAVLLPGSNAPVISVPVTIGVGTASPAVNTATVSGGGDASCPAAAHCQSTTTTTLNAPRLDVTKLLQGNFVVGVQSSYVITVTNNGQADTLGGTVSDTIPTGLTIGALPAGCTAAGQLVTCNLPAGISAGTSISYTIPVTPTAALIGQSVTNSATASGGGDATCPAQAHCTGTTTNTVGAPQLSITKSATPSTFVVGVAASYTLTVTNTGSAATTTAATVSDTVPTGLAIGTLPSGCTAAGQAVTCTIAAGLATGTPVSFTIPVTPQPSLSGLSVTNMATATGGGDASCPAGGNPSTLPPRCVGTTTTPINAPQLTLHKSASASNFVVGVPASYTLTVTNTGTAATTVTATAIVSDLIPADVVIGTPLPIDCTAMGQQISCSVASGLAVGASVSFVIPVTATAAASGQNLINTANISGGGDPSCPGAAHCSSTVTTPVDAPQLSIVKAASAANFVVGVPASYTLTVTNAGSAATTAAATVSDAIPASLTLGAPLPAGCTASGQNLTCTIASGLAVGANVVFTIPVTATAAASGTTVVNTATVSGGGDPTCPGAAHCSSTVDTPVDAPELNIVKTASVANFIVGVPASYTLTVTNAGSAATTAAATVSDTIPASLTIGAPLPAGCSASGQSLTCTIASGLAVGANVVFTIPVTATAAASGTTVVNTATVSGGGDATCPAAAHCSSTVDTPVDAPELNIVKTASVANFVVGVPASYVLTVTNPGSAATTAVATVSDTMPAALTLGTPLPAGCSASGQSVTCTIASGLAVGANVAFTIPVTATAAASGTTVVNTATVSGGGDATCPAAAHCSSTVDTPVDAPQLSLVKTASAMNFVVGVPAGYTLTVTNTGSAATTAVATVSDTMPASLTIGTPLPAGCGASGQSVTCTIASGLAVGANTAFTIPVTATAAASGTTVVNTAMVSGGGDATCPGAVNCSSTVNTPVDAPQINIVKSASVANFVVGVPASYTLTVTNAGSAATTAAATVSDTIPASLTIGTPLPAGCTAAGQSLTCTIASGLAVGANVALTIPVTATAAASGTTVVNTATVSGGGDATCPAAAHCSSTVDTPVDAPQLSLVKTASAMNFVVGVPASYTLTVTNTGSAATTAVATVSDTIPASLTLGTPLPAGCGASGQSVTCTIASGLAVGANVAFTIPVTATVAASGTTVVNIATVSGGGDATCPAAAHCSSTVDTPVDAPQLSLVKTASAMNFVVGVPAGYTLTVTNTGSAATTAVATVSDTIPAALTIGTPLPAGCSASGQSVTCTVASGLAVGANAAFTIPVTATAAASGTTVVNTAMVSGGGDATCPGAVNCSSTVNTPVDAPQLNIVKTTSVANFVVGVPAGYALTVTNTGSAATTAAATVSDTIPASLTLGAPLPAGCSASGQSVTCTIASGLAVGANAVFTIPVTATAVASGTTVVNTATVFGGGDASCPGATHCSGTANTPVDAPQLSIIKTASVANFVVGVPASYTLTVTNTGSAATTAVATVSDTIPASLSIGAPLPAGCTASGQSVTCTIASGLAVGANAAFTIPVTATAAASGTTVVNTATVSGGGDATCSGAVQCSSTVNTPVDAPQLSIVKTASVTNFVVGLPASYTLTVTNTGSAATTAAATVSDTVPASLTLGTPLPAGCTASGQSVTCTIASGLAAGANVAFTIPVTPTAAASGTTVVNTATVSGGGDATCPGAVHCSDTVSIPTEAPQLTLVKTASTSNFVVGVPASYTLTVSNTGSAATIAVSTVTDPMPAGLDLGSLPADCSASGQVVTCSVPAGLAVGASVSFVIPVTPNASISGVITNTATVSGDGCPGSPNCAATVGVPVGSAADLAVTKSDGGVSVLLGGTVSYQLTVSNAGPNTATAPTLADPTPPGLNLVSATAPCAGGFPCSLADLAAGASVVVTVTYQVPASYSGPQPISNTASVTSTTPDPNPASNTATDTTPTLQPPTVRPVPALGLPGLLLLSGLLAALALLAHLHPEGIMRRGAKR